MNDKTLQSSLEVNEKQKMFYNSTSQQKKNFASRIWSNLRNGLLNNFASQFDIKKRVYDQHKIWLGDLGDKKVLDLGCLRGNVLSLYMAKNAKEYVAIDLSDVAIKELQNKIEKANCPNAVAKAVDFLSDEFTEMDFDVIYAYGVLHHFRDFDLLLHKLDQKLSSKGIIISYDPLETSLPIKILRAVYRPFQSDKDWEWPFKKTTFKKIGEHYNIVDKKGILGRSKYGIAVNFLPLSTSRKKEIITKSIERDWNLSSWADAYTCMHITMLLEKKN